MRSEASPVAPPPVAVPLDPADCLESCSVSLTEKMPPVECPMRGEESAKARVERLGRQRPEKFKSLWAEVGFIFALSMSQVLSEYFVSGFTVVLPAISADLDISDASRTWPASAFSLTLAAFLFMFGRLADMYGGYPLYVAGAVWLAVWSLVAGFTQNELVLNVCRGLQGLGPAAFLPSSMMLLGSIYRPGPRKNLVFSIYGAAAPFGFFVGIFFAGLTGELSTWSWYFWVGTIFSVITAVTAYLTVPSDVHERRALAVEMDWLGAVLMIGGLILFTAAIIDISHASNGWRSPHIIALLVVGVILLVAAGYVESCVATNPLLPPSFFRVPHMTPLIIALFLTYGSLGIFLLYATFYMTDILGATPLLVVAWYVPMAFGGCIISTFGGFVLHLLPGTFLIIIAGTSWIVAPLLFAIAPDDANYWVHIFPSMVCATIGIDITFNITNIFVTTSLPKKQQGLAGSVTMFLLHLTMALDLGFADIVNVSMLPALGMKGSYKAVFWLEVACASAALFVLVCFVKIKKAESALTADELEELGGCPGSVEMLAACGDLVKGVP